MSHQDLKKQLNDFQALIDKLPEIKDKQKAVLRQHYIDQNIDLLNDILVLSIEHLKRLSKTESVNDIISTQAHLTMDIHNKIVITNRRFLDASMGKIADYNEWLQTHCDQSTD